MASPFLELLVGLSAAVGGAAMTGVAKWSREARTNSDKALRILRGEQNVDDEGLMDVVAENREALHHADLYPPAPRSDGNRPEDEQAIPWRDETGGGSNGR